MVKAGWLDRYSYDESIEILHELALLHAAKAGPHAAILQDLLDRRDWIGLLDFKLPYGQNDDVDHLVHARQALAFFQKFEPLKLKGVSKTKEAFRKFAATEARCHTVNERFRNYRNGTPMGYPWDTILVSAREKILDILGPVPDVTQLHFRFGPGATRNVKKKDASARVKLGVPLQCSNELVPYLRNILAELPNLAEHHGEVLADDENIRLIQTTVEVVPGRLEFVPKDAMKYRTITVEPGLNVLVQQGIGRALRRRLMKAGVSLNDQTRNQGLAQLGSVFDNLATVDFSAASDTISTELVHFLLPSRPNDWAVLMSMARTRTVQYNGLLIALEKFSTMGNSFTFELESLIFYTLALSVVEFLGLPSKDVSIFGDDLIIPSDAYELAVLVFGFCGFEINTRKSYHRGPFRESCGADFFRGMDIRPYYQKELVTGETLFTLHNFYMRAGELALAERVRNKWIHPDLQLFGPDGCGDGHLLGTWEGVKKRIKCVGVGIDGIRTVKKYPHTHLGWGGVYFKSYRRTRNENLIPHHGDKLLPTYSIYVRGSECEEGLSDYPADPLNSSDSRPLPFSNQEMWADSRHFVVPDSLEYEVVFIYTMRRGVFI